MTSIKQEANIIKYRKNRHMNIGILIFGIIFVYLIATIIMYITAPKITVYEVRQGSILKDTAYTGLAIREETVVYADDSGYVNYYAEDNSKVKVGSDIYSLSNEKIVFDTTVSEENVALSKEESHAILLKIQNYNEQFQESDFAATYQLKNEIRNSINKITSHNKTEQLYNSNLAVQSAAIDGIVVYSFDGMEDLTVENVTVEQLNKSNYKNNHFTNNSQIKSGAPVYKIVTSNNWSLLVAVSDETKEALSDKKTVKVNFKKDNQEIRANLSFLENTATPIVRLSFTDSMIRYINERYLDIELILEDESGLKIPKSAETSKDFYVVPRSYLTQGGNSSSDGVMRRSKNKDENEITEFLQVTVYYEEGESIYLDTNVFERGDVLVKPDSAETYPLNETKSLKGVYCINKGYAVFKQIQILCESDEYYIIEEGNSFGLSNYDHIVLDGNSVNENDVVF